MCRTTYEFVEKTLRGCPMKQSLLKSARPFCAATLLALAGCAGTSDIASDQGLLEKKEMMSRDQKLSDLSQTAAGSDFTEEGLEALKARVRRFVDDGDAAGVSGLLVKDGEVVQYVEAGVQNVETGAPLTQDTIFRIYSMTKPIVGVAMMMLYDEGAFALD
ncbi:MAG: serine hydrolase domain-containing protein, partial [Pseudomonadota bacterium]